MQCDSGARGLSPLFWCGFGGLEVGGEGEAVVWIGGKGVDGGNGIEVEGAVEVGKCAMIRHGFPCQFGMEAIALNPQQYQFCLTGKKTIRRRDHLL